MSTIFILFFYSMLKEITIFLKLKLRYKSQNIPISYLPIIGDREQNEPKKNERNPKNADDNLEPIKKSYEKIVTDHDMIAINSGGSFRVRIDLLSKKAIKEFLTKETNNTIKIPSLNIGEFGLFWKNGPKVSILRKTFKNILHPQNLYKMAPNLSKIARDHLKILKLRIPKQASKGFNKKDLKEDVRKF